MTSTGEFTEQSVKDLLAEVRRIQVVASRQVDEVMAGEYQSAFRGRGMEFDEVREYVPGDDVRDIDWNVTARTGRPHIKRFVEERELTLMFLVDLSASGIFGSEKRTKIHRIVEVCAVLMFNALRNNDKVGLIAFADDVIEFIPPRKGKSHTLRLLRDLLAVRPRRGETNIDSALDYFARIQRRKSVVFLISDFIGFDNERILSRIAARHDLIVVSVNDPKELKLPDAGIITLEDAETGLLVDVDTSNPKIRRIYEQRMNAIKREREILFRRTGVDELAIDTVRPFSHSLHEFFRRRDRRMR